MQERENRSKVSFRQSVWPVKSRQMPIKTAKKLFLYKNERFWNLYKNCLKCGQFGQNIWWHRLWKVAQSAIHHPIWPHWFQINFGKRNCPGQLLWHWFVGLAIGYSSSNDDDGTAHVKRLLLNCINLFDSKPGAECRAVVGREVCR